MARLPYTVSLVTLAGNSEVSRFFNTIAAARRWSKFLLSTSGVREVSIYRGEAGGELLERATA